MGQGDPTDIWVPFQTREDLRPWGRSPDSKDSLYGFPTWLFLLMIGRLQPGVSQTQALAELTPTFQHALYEGIGKRDAKEQPSKLYFTRPWH